MPEYLPPRAPRKSKHQQAQEREVLAKATGGCLGLILGILAASLILMLVWNGVIVDPDDVGLRAGEINYGNAVALWLFVGVLGRAFNGARYK